MKDFYSKDMERSESYRILADLFLRPPDDTDLEVIKADFGLESKENSILVREDFDALFAYPKGTLQPLESSFINEGASVLPAIAEFYSTAGLALDENYGLPPDHLVTELLFMSYLVDAGKTSLQKDFLQQHLMNWIPDLCNAVMQQAKTVFYREMAEILLDFLTAEHEEFIE